MVHMRAAGFGAVLIVLAAALGGCQGGGATAPRFDTGTAYPWVTKSSLPLPLAGQGAVGINGSVYTMGASPLTLDIYRSKVLVYNPPTDTWAVKGDKPTSRGAFGVGAANNLMYTIGGLGSFADDFGRKTVEAYDPTSDTWTTKASLPKDTRGGAVSGNDRFLYMASSAQLGLYYGGYARKLNTLNAYDSATNSWTSKPVWPSERVNVSLGVVNNIVYVIGGIDLDVGAVAVVEAFDPSTNTWTTKAPLPTARSGVAIGVVNNIMYVIGGVDVTHHATAVVEAYDPSTNTWTTKPPMLTARADMVIARVNSTLYVMGGSANYKSLPTVEAFTP
jgi:N-acetylneuraminic acid mutarotase